MAGMGDITTRIHSILRAPLHTRINELSLLVDRLPFKDLQAIYPQVVGSIFGNGGASEDWGLRTVTSQNNTYNFELLFNFLIPTGPLFKICYKLIGDPQLKYVFPTRLLPLDVFQMLESGKVPQFYVDLLNVDPHTRQIISLSLNPFDYLIFHFAVHLFNASYSRGVCDNWNTVYHALSYEYLLHFLPSDPSAAILPHIPYFTGKTPAVSPMQTANRHTQFPSLLVCQDLAANSGVGSGASTQPHPRGEVWRSETVLQVFIDVWLSTSTQTETSQNATNSVLPLKSTYPVSEHVRIARFLIKQCHGFWSSGEGDPTSLGELRRAACAALAPSAHAHIRHLMHIWPLDSSFRLVLELWFSFIQPWRYINLKDERFGSLNRMESPIEETNRSTVIDSMFMPFITENLLAYTEIFELVVPRFLRLDLTVPKNAIMLFRLTKVFSQSNLIQMLAEVETSIASEADMVPLPFSPRPYSFSPFIPTSPSSFVNSNSVCLDRSNNLDNSYPKYVESGTPSLQVCRWERDSSSETCPAVEYKALFLGNGKPMALDLLFHAQQAYNQSIRLIQTREEQTKIQQRGFFGFISYWLMGDSESGDEISLEEMKKVPVYIQSSIQQLAEIFSLDTATQNSQLFRDRSFSDSNSNSSGSRSRQNISRFSVPMSPKQAKERLNHIKYMGDPDLQPIRSNENGFLVKLLQHISSRINEMYCEEMKMLWEKDDFVGVISREVLEGPREIRKFSKGGSFDGELIRHTLSPRISLRSFASHATIFWFIVFCVISHLLGYGVLLFILFVVSVWTFLILFKGLLKWVTGSTPSRVNRHINSQFNSNSLDNSVDSERFFNT